MSHLLDLMKERQSVYKIGKNSPVSLDQVKDQLTRLAQEAPSAFNSQTSRYVIISGQAHDLFWDTIHEVQKEVLSPEMYEIMSERFVNAKQGLGTVLLFEDRDQVDSMPTNKQRAHLYKENNHAMAALTVWLGLSELGLGASLQHHNIGYEEGFDQVIRDLLGLPDSYEMLAQMPFGSIEEPGANKDKIDPQVQVQVISEIN